MPSRNDKHPIRIAFGKHRGKVENKEMTWGKFARRLEVPYRDTTVTFAEYLDLSPDEQGKLKLAPGYIVGAWFTDGIRHLRNMQAKYLLSFDMDFLTPAQFDLIEQELSDLCRYEFLTHSTRKHSAKKPRLRVHMPMTRPVTPEEFDALTRIVASRIFPDPQESIDAVDTVSHRLAQISYLPSISRNQDYYYAVNEGEILNPDVVLASFDGDWRDVTQLPRRSDEKTIRATDQNRKMEDPREKPGVIGAFCRAYDIHQAIEEFLPDVYEASDSQDDHPRYRYLLGSGTAAGMVVYDDGLFMTTHHGSDPVAGSANAFDMVRIHKFGHLDAKAPVETALSKLPSFLALEKLALADKAVRAELAAAVAGMFDIDEDEDEAPPPKPQAKPKSKSVLDQEAEDMLGDSDESDDDPEDGEPEPASKAKPDREWVSRLQIDKQERLIKSKFNVNTIISNDHRIAPYIARDDMTGGPCVRGKFKFKKLEVIQPAIDNPVTGRKWVDTDTAALAGILSAPRDLGGYETDFSQLDLQQAMLLAAEKNKFNPVIDTINLTKWDGVPRVDTLFIEHLWVPDNAYHRELARVWCVAAVARLYEPGHKFDLVPILGGKGGGGKSGFIAILGLGFMGTLANEFDNTQKMVESTRGKWIMEMAELKGMSSAEVEDVKHFVSSTSDTIRLAYRHNEEDFKRRCVLMGTTNEGQYLRDTTGNRRFCPVITPTTDTNRMHFKALEDTVNQVWAEAQAIYFQMRKDQPHGMLPLNLRSDEAIAEAQRLQEESREAGPHEVVAELVTEWLDMRVPASVALRGASDKFDADPGEQFYVRGAVTAKQVLEEFGAHPVLRSVRQSPDKLVGMALAAIPGWKKLQSPSGGPVMLGGLKARWYVRDGNTKLTRWVRSDPPDDDMLG